MCCEACVFFLVLTSVRRQHQAVDPCRAVAHALQTWQNSRNHKGDGRPRSTGAYTEPKVHLPSVNFAKLKEGNPGETVDRGRPWSTGGSHGAKGTYLV